MEFSFPSQNLTGNMSKFSIEGQFRNFEIINGSQYYVPNSLNSTIVIFDKNWQVIGTKTFNSTPYYLKTVNQTFFISNQTAICKTDFNAVILLCTKNFTGFRSIYYNATNKTISAVSYIDKSVLTYDLNLTLVDRFLTGHALHGINAYNNDLVLSASAGRILILRNGVFISNYTTLCTGWIPQIYIDSAGYMTVPCYETLMMYLYHVNGTFLNKSIPLSSKPLYFNYDLNDNSVVIGETEIYVF